MNRKTNVEESFVLEKMTKLNRRKEWLEKERRKEENNARKGEREERIYEIERERIGERMKVNTEKLSKTREWKYKRKRERERERGRE